jgi:hypothetical protein
MGGVKPPLQKPNRRASNQGGPEGRPYKGADKPVSFAQMPATQNGRDKAAPTKAKSSRK